MKRDLSWDKVTRSHCSRILKSLVLVGIVSQSTNCGTKTSTFVLASALHALEIFFCSVTGTRADFKSMRIFSGSDFSEISIGVEDGKSFGIVNIGADFAKSPNELAVAESLETVGRFISLGNTKPLFPNEFDPKDGSLKPELDDMPLFCR